MEQDIPQKQPTLSQIQMRHEEIAQKFIQLHHLLHIQLGILEKATTHLIDSKQINQSRKVINNLSKKLQSLRMANTSKLINQQQAINQQRQKQFALSQYQDKLNRRLYVLVDKQADIVYDHIGKKEEEKTYFSNVGYIDSASRQIQFMQIAIGQLSKERGEVKKIERVLQGVRPKHNVQIEEEAKKSTSTIQSGPHEQAGNDFESIKQEINSCNQDKKTIQNPQTAYLTNNQTQIYQMGLLYKLIQQEDQKYMKLSTSYTCLKKQHARFCRMLHSSVQTYNANK